MIGEYMVLPTPLITHNESCVIKNKGFYFSNSKIVFFLQRGRAFNVSIKRGIKRRGSLIQVPPKIVYYIVSKAFSVKKN